ncbi:MAG TPA: ATP-dependent zinc metalloprotease FtsH [bacterium]|nr:ATP-dependent zinc metalloprotease FtsH [bacterium]HXK95039.1 ATP-dependent zinc metalloprotease FtsH [bacterium]
MFNKTIIFYGLLLIIIILVVSGIQTEQASTFTLDQFYGILDGEIIDKQLHTAVISPSKIEGEYIDLNAPQAKKAYEVTLASEQLTPEVVRKCVEYKKKNPAFSFKGQADSNWMFSVMTSLLPILLLIGVWFFILRQMQIGGSKAMSFGKSRARLSSENQQKVTFDDVAGCDEAKEELREIVEFLKDPKKFQKLGGKIPHGVLLHGSPGTGKTLLARAVAGEANVPFFSISGSDFVEMFVGVGASRVRDLFEQGKKHSPCIIFMDEIDAVGRQRFAGVGGGHDEREQTLNQLLVEMDGFNTNEEVILIAATNRPDVLDPALLRPGRFDRQIVIDLPDLNGRKGIIAVHTRNVVLAKNVDFDILARRTPGFSGADIHSMVNEAALLAARRNKDVVDMQDFEDAIERVTAGPERKSRAITDREKRIVAYHEAGHAVVGWFLDEIDPVHKVSILPRGRALGYTMHLPVEDRYLTTKKELQARMTTLLGGRVAEDIIFGDVTTGAQNDLERVTDIAHKMICNFGMSEKLGPLTFGLNENQIFLGRDFYKDREYSEEIQFEIDKEIRQLVDECYHRAKNILETNRDILDGLAQALLEQEVLSADAVRDLVNRIEEARKSKAGTQEIPPDNAPDNEAPIAVEVPVNAGETPSSGGPSSIAGEREQPIGESR